MSDDYKMRELAADAMDEAARLSTVGIVSGSGKNKWKGLGTGTLIRWKGQPAILTANHVIRGTSAEDLRFFLPLENPPKTVERDVLLSMRGAATTNLLPFSPLHVGGVIADADLDVAVILVDEKLDGRHPAARFFEMAPGGHTPTEGALVSRGFPHDLSRWTEANEGVVFMYGHWTTVVAIPDGHSNVDPEIHFVAPFDDPDKKAHPAGLSGSAQWFRRSTPPPSLWTPNLDIGGITISYLTPERLLKMVRREAVEYFLSSRIG